MARKPSPAEPSVLLRATRDDDFVATFWARVSRTDGCWTWTGGRSGPYGQLQYQRQRLLAHRFSWALFTKQDCPEAQVVRHRCDNPPCVRPDHLELGSVAQNVRDTYARRRRVTGNPNVGTARPNSILSDDMVADLRRRARSGQSITSIAAGAGLGYSTAYRAIRGKGWPHVSEPPVPGGRWSKPHPNNFLRNHPDVAAKARSLRDEGLTLQQIADHLGITKTAAFRCCRTQTKEAS